MISAAEVIWKIESITQLCFTQQTSQLPRVKYNGNIETTKTTVSVPLLVVHFVVGWIKKKKKKQCNYMVFCWNGI